jgi:hypothetical protein
LRGYIVTWKERSRLSSHLSFGGVKWFKSKVGQTLIGGIFNKEEISFYTHVDLMVGDHPREELSWQDPETIQLL